MTRLTARRCHGEEGAYLLLYALMTVAIFGMAALVLDLAAIRQDRREARLSADLAATAGAADLDLANPFAAVNACNAAWAYLAANARDLVATAPNCAATFTPPCTAVTPPRTVAVTAAPFAVEITNPVPDAHALMTRELNRGDEAQAVTPGDGDPCERLGVRIRRARDADFGPIVGFMGATTDVHSVARAAQTTTGGTFASLAALERTGCNAVVNDGLDDLRIGSSAAPGTIWLDSDASLCTAGAYVVNRVGSGTVTVAGSGGGLGTIYSWAAALGRGSFALPPAPATAPAAAVAAPRPMLREPFDDRYNCQDNSCAPNPPAIDQLRTRMGTSGRPAGFVDYDCTGAVPPLLGVDYYVRCGSIPGSVTFTGDVLFDGPVDVPGCLAVNSTGCGALSVASRDSVIFFRNGNIQKRTPSSQLFLERTMVHGSGPMLFEPGNGDVVWTAPTGGAFEDLLMWNETTSATPTVLDEQRGAWQIVGAIFVPNAAVEVRATTPPPKPIPFLEMQVFAKTFAARGNGSLHIAPRADRGVIAPIRTVRLIR